MKKIIIFLLFVFSLAAAQTRRPVIKIVHQHYTTFFSESLYYPILVQWTLTAGDVCGRNDRNRVNRGGSLFTSDPQLNDFTDLEQYYTHNLHGWQRGHNCPAADNSCNPTYMQECFYFSNMTPQNANLNEHRWSLLERRERTLAKKSPVQVFCGSYGFIEMLGPISVPAYCWKILKHDNVEEVYIFPNVDTVMRHPYTYYQQETSQGVASIRSSTKLTLPGL